MADPKTPTTARPKAPGPDVVEALASPGAALFLSAAIEEAGTALSDRWNTDGRTLTPTQKATLRLLGDHGAQLVTATTIPGSGS